MIKTDMEIMRMNRDEAIERIMNGYGDEIKRLIYTYLKNTADTDDVTQEVFILVYRKLHSFQGKSSLKSWIYSIAINKSKDYLRNWRVRNRRLKEKLMQTASHAEKETNTPEESTLKQSESDELLDQVMNLKTKYREAIILYHFEELTIKEISSTLSVKQATVRTRLKRGREKLQALIETDGGEVDA